MKRRKSPVIAALFLTVCGTPAFTGETNLTQASVTETGAAERIEAVDRLLTLSQEIPSAACHFHEGIEVAVSEKLLAEGTAKFDLLLDALFNGNEDLKIIGGEKRRKTIAELEAIEEEWHPIEDAALLLLESPHDPAALKIIRDTNMHLLADVEHLQSELEAEYSNPVELVQADVMLIHFSGRQSMLTQQMAKEACEVWSGHRTPAHIDALTKSIQTYDVTLQALLDGMPAAGIKAAPTPEIADDLRHLKDDWQIIKTHLGTILETENIDEAVKSKVYLELNDAMKKFDALVHKYTLFAHHQYG